MIRFITSSNRRLVNRLCNVARCGKKNFLKKAFKQCKKLMKKKWKCKKGMWKCKGKNKCKKDKKQDIKKEEVIENVKPDIKKEEVIQNVKIEEQETVDLKSIIAVSYTHLTLPTKRIV